VGLGVGETAATWVSSHDLAIVSGLITMRSS
jgi:hypothetical protein